MPLSHFFSFDERMNNRTIAIVLGAIMILGGVGYWYLYSINGLPNGGGPDTPTVPPPVHVAVQAIITGPNLIGERCAYVYVTASSTYEDDSCVTVASGSNPTIALRPTVTYSFHVYTYYMNIETNQPTPEIYGELNSTVTMPYWLTFQSVIQISVFINNNLPGLLAGAMPTAIQVEVS
jgi:hypothetical protein